MCVYVSVNSFVFDVVDEKFQKLLNGFMDEHYHHFEDEEENKFIYTDIFNLYVSDMILVCIGHSNMNIKHILPLENLYGLGWIRSQ